MGGPDEITPTAALSDDDVAAFERDGFLRIEALADPAELPALVAAYDALFAGGQEFHDGDLLSLVDGDGDDEAGTGRGPALPQIVNPERYAPSLVAGPTYAAARAIAERLLGRDCVRLGNHAICKPAHHGAATPWHQDEAYWDPRFEHEAVSIWIPLQPVSESNGCMAFVPGSHLGPVLEHELIDPATHGLRAVDPGDTSSAFVCPLPTGGATVHGGRTLHYAGPNPSDQPRRAIVFEFGRPPAPRSGAVSMPWQRPEWYGADPAPPSPVTPIDRAPTGQERS